MGKNAGHPDLADYTVGRKKCAIPQGASSTAGVVRQSSLETATTATSEPLNDVHVQGGSSTSGVVRQPSLETATNATSETFSNVNVATMSANPIVPMLVMFCLLGEAVRL